MCVCKNSQTRVKLFLGVGVGKITKSFRRALFSRDKNLHIFPIYFHLVFFCCWINIFMASGRKSVCAIASAVNSVLVFPLEPEIVIWKKCVMRHIKMQIPMNIFPPSQPKHSPVSLPRWRRQKINSIINFRLETLFCFLSMIQQW